MTNRYWTERDLEIFAEQFKSAAEGWPGDWDAVVEFEREVARRDGLPDPYEDIPECCFQGTPLEFDEDVAFANGWTRPDRGGP